MASTETKAFTPAIMEDDKLKLNTDILGDSISRLSAFTSPENHQWNYTLSEKLGAGSFGEVWKGEKHENHEAVAIKKIKLPESTYSEDVNNVISEISNLKESNHSNIVRYRDSFIVEDAAEKQVWLVMDYLNGMNLSDLKNQVNLSPALISYVCTETLQALMHLHKRGIIHRDVKGGNIMITSQGKVLLTDFGLTCQEGDDLSAGAGTIGFMAPEVYNTNNYSCKADIWSLGMVVMEMVTRQYPFDCLDCKQRRKLTTDGLRPRIKCKHLPDSLHDFIDHCLEVNPSMRPSAEDLLQHQFLKTHQATAEELSTSVNKAHKQLEPDKLDCECVRCDFSHIKYLNPKYQLGTADFLVFGLLVIGAILLVPLHNSHWLPVFVFVGVCICKLVLPAIESYVNS